MEVIDKYTDPKTKEKWQAVKSGPANFYPFWLRYFKDKDADIPLCVLPFTEGAEEWLREFLNGREM